MKGRDKVTPLSFEWQWNIEYLIFMGLLYIALMIIGCGLIYAFIKTWFDLNVVKKDPPPEISYRAKYPEY